MSNTHVNVEALYDFGYDDLAERVVSGWEDAIVGIVTNGNDFAIGYDYSKIPCDQLELVPDEDYIVEFMDEPKALETLGNVILFGSDGENEYKDCIVGITQGHLLYDYDKIVEYKVKTNSEPVTVNGITIGPMSYEDAIEDLEYNTLRAMPYYPEGPRIIMNRDFFEN